MDRETLKVWNVVQEVAKQVEFTMRIIKIQQKVGLIDQKVITSSIWDMYHRAKAATQAVERTKPVEIS